MWSKKAKAVIVAVLAVALAAIIVVFVFNLPGRVTAREQAKEQAIAQEKALVASYNEFFGTSLTKIPKPDSVYTVHVYSVIDTEKVDKPKSRKSAKGTMHITTKVLVCKIP